MAKELLALLEPLEPSGFVIGEGEKPLTKIAERRMLQRVERKIDLYGATPHIFRHTYATLLSASGDVYKRQPPYRSSFPERPAPWRGPVLRCAMTLIRCR